MISFLLIAYFRTRSGRIVTPHQRAWADIEGAIRGKDEPAVLEECERGEDVAKKSYENALTL